MTECETKSALSPQGTPYDKLSHFVNVDGQHLFTRNWEPSEEIETRAVALICHGLGEHCGRYDTLAEVLVAKGIWVYTHDHVGHGQSEGIRLDVTDFGIFIRDVLQHTDIIKEKHPGLPIFLIGHSMGGTIAILTMIERKADFAGCVLIGAAIVINPDEATPFKVFLARVSAYLFPQFGIAALDPKLLSRDPKQVEDYASDPLVYHGKIKARIASQLVKGMDNIASFMGGIEWPVLILHGEMDRLTSNAGSKLLHEKIKSKDKTLKIYPGYYHVLHREIPSDAAIVKEDIASWIEERIDKKPAEANDTDTVVEEKKETNKENDQETTKEEPTKDSQVAESAKADNDVGVEVKHEE
ncbi:monoglyceride lipase-like [Anneissia japonica]|uniref:monoglyceride lipase-like n=1 Tax=Anneissia japonica TaxID=1529436 RepID=UPI0014259FC2|nr:monoglyceride lipase-like [Anneissia japonica]XP_033099204.1 monoglyceride lipase-like [Anneissia japonica]